MIFQVSHLQLLSGNKLNKNILVTGASGFIGQNIFFSLRKEASHAVYGTIRSNKPNFQNIENLHNLDLLNIDDVKKFFQEFNFDLVIHCAAIAHQNNTNESDILDGALKNKKITENIITAMKSSNCNNIIFMSSIGIYGENSSNFPFNEKHSDNPFNIYTNSKLSCEKIIQSSPSIKSIILRLPLVYGVAAPGNFKKLKQVISKTPFLIFGNAVNKRSYLFIENLTDLLRKVSKGVFKFNEIYNVADLETISTNNLILEISRLQNRNIYNFKIHKNLIHFIFKILGKEKDFYRIYNSLEIDISKVMSDYEWEPKYSINEGLKQTLIDC